MYRVQNRCKYPSSLYHPSQNISESCIPPNLSMITACFHSIFYSVPPRSGMQPYQRRHCNALNSLSLGTLIRCLKFHVDSIGGSGHGGKTDIGICRKTNFPIRSSHMRLRHASSRNKSVSRWREMLLLYWHHYLPSPGIPPGKPELFEVL